MAAKSIADTNGESLQVVCIGGVIHRVAVTAGVWTEFVPPAGHDAFNYEFDADLAAAGISVRRTSSANFPDLDHGAAVTPAHLKKSMSVFDVQVPLGMDVDWGQRFFFTAIGGDVVLKLESLAR